MGFGLIRGSLQEAAALVKSGVKTCVERYDRGHRVGVLEQRR